jgi:N-acetylgalactosamine kinase
MATNSPTASIVLCAGKGRRMQAPRTPKVCFPIAGKPAIIHLLERLEAQAVHPNVLVVGHLAGEVVDEVGPRFPETVFAYQEELLGTGNAAKQGAQALQELGFSGAVLVVAGDKVVEASILRKLADAFHAEHADLAMIVAPKQHWPSAGRIITDESGNVARIIEHSDLRNAEEQGESIEIAGVSRPATEVEADAQWVNQAVYIYRTEALYAALDRLTRDNVQDEEYLTDTIEILVSDGAKIVTVPVDTPEDVLAFNNPEELLHIEEHFQQKTGAAPQPEVARDPRIFKPPQEWARRLSDTGPGTRALLEACYGTNPDLIEEKRRSLLHAVEEFMTRYGGDGPVTVVRAPGRINLMGRHIDHRGGCVNLMAIDREHIVVARGRDDTLVRARNADLDSFEDLSFDLADLLKQVRLDDWREFVDSDAVIRMIRDLEGNWGNYIKAPMLRLQQEFKDRHIRGMDCLVYGDIPMAAGLSSSSALVVAAAEAFALWNGLAIAPHDLVDVCGEGEWFVGTRGGSADHAAVKLSQFGQVAHVSFFPFAIEEYVPFPRDYALVIGNSRIQARKAAGARDTFNERVASYELAVRIVRKRFPNYAPTIHHLRDISPAGLGVRPADIYRLLLEVPETMTPGALIDELGEEQCQDVFTTHRQPHAYPLRARLLFGIAECARSTHCVDLLRNGDMETFGQLMNLSHDGDRIVDTEGEPYAPDMDDKTIRTFIDGLQSDDPDRVLEAQLYAQPGAYACSTPEIDRMADIVRAVPGVVGAQLSGAGLGGCMMVLVERPAADAAVEALNTGYYEPAGLEPGAAPFIPIAGSAPLMMD